ncbi:MAG: AraC family transcriptional regulator [Clostridiales bacterium]|nr:AraC family transcriptional regulator [Clostridiales bacterium]
MQSGEKFERQLRSFSMLAGCGCMCTDDNLSVGYNRGSCSFSCPAKGGIESSSGDEGCIWSHRRAAYGAEKFGGKYIYFCPAGFIFCIAKYAGKTESGYLLAGPMNVSENADFVPGDASGEIDISRIDREQFLAFQRTVPYVDSQKVSAVSDMLQALALSQSENRSDMRENEEKMQIQQQIGDYVQSIKSRMILGIDKYSPYPYDKEKLLVHAIKSGDEKEAKKYLNEILGHIFFASANNIDTIKLRAFELTVLISRAALDGGADAGSIYQLSPQFISDFFALDTIDDICYCLMGILKKFSAETFGIEKAKHVGIITQVVSFIRNNYMHKITLLDVASHVFLSPSYLSKIFKEEMQTSFNSYLSEVRIEKSKILLLSNDLSIVEVSELVGFLDQSYFNKVFKKQTGMTPKKYRETNGGLLAD